MLHVMASKPMSSANTYVHIENDSYRHNPWVQGPSKRHNTYPCYRMDSQYANHAHTWNTLCTT